MNGLLISFFICLCAVAPLISAEAWECGHSFLDHYVTYHTAEMFCSNETLEHMNACCVAHDLCYDRTDIVQAYCDNNFCGCLDAARLKSISENKKNHQNPYQKGMMCFIEKASYCAIVKEFGFLYFTG